MNIQENTLKWYLCYWDGEKTIAFTSTSKDVVIHIKNIYDSTVFSGGEICDDETLDITMERITKRNKKQP